MNTVRTAMYNGTTWLMRDADPQTFLDQALVPHYPDLQGATFTERPDPNNPNGVIYEYQKRAGTKG